MYFVHYEVDLKTWAHRPMFLAPASFHLRSWALSFELLLKYNVHAKEGKQLTSNSSRCNFRTFSKLGQFFPSAILPIKIRAKTRKKKL